LPAGQGAAILDLGRDRPESRRHTLIHDGAEPMRLDARPLLPLAPAFGLLVLAAGCDSSNPKPNAGAEKPGSIVGQKTQEVLPLQEALQKEPDARVAATDIAASDYLSQLGAAYKTSVAKIAAMQIQQAIAMRQAMDISVAAEKPLTYDEFMSEIIKKDRPDGIMLPKLPPYMVYAWDEANQQLVAVEYPGQKQRIMEGMPGRTEPVK
jgi:hypothetical protein